MFICHCATIDNQHKTVLTSISLKCIQFEFNYTTRPEILDSIKDFVAFCYNLSLKFTRLSVIDTSNVVHVNSLFLLYYYDYIAKNS